MKRVRCRTRGSGLATIAVVYETESDAIFAAMSGLDTTRQNHINNLVISLKAIGWAKFGSFFVFAAHNQAGARVDWKTPANTLTENNSPTFTIDRGYTGNASNMYLDLNINNTTLAQDDHHFGVWSRTSGQLTEAVIGTSQNSLGLRSGSDQIFVRSSNTTGGNSSGTNTDGSGHYVANRTTSTTANVYRNGSFFGNHAQTSSAPSSQEIFVLARNNGAGTATGFTSRQIAAAHTGTGLTAGEISSLRTALAAYMTAVGA